MTNNNVLHLQSSQMTTFMECPRKWYYNYVKWRGQKATPPMTKGTVFHLMGELHYRDGVPFEDLGDHITLAQQNSSTGENYVQHIPEVLPAFMHYAAQRSTSPYEFYIHEGKPAIELEFALELTPTIIYHGKFDSIRERDGKLYIFDWKVTSMSLTDWYFKKFEMCYQTFAYSFTGKTCFPNLEGFFIDAIQIKNGNHNFCTKYFPLLNMFDEFVAELIRTGEWIQAHIHDENFFEHRYTGCVNKYNKLCPYAPVCSAKPGRREAILASDLFDDVKPIYDFS